MDRISKEINNYSKGLVLILFSSIFLTMFLFYIDEGYYNFKWMTNVGSWMIFLFYAAIIFTGQLFMSILLSRFKNKFGKWLAIVFGGAIIGTMIAVIFIFK